MSLLYHYSTKTQLYFKFNVSSTAVVEEWSNNGSQEDCVRAASLPQTLTYAEFIATHNWGPRNFDKN